MAYNTLYLLAGKQNREKQMKTEPGIRKDYISKLGTVEDAVQVFIAREQVALNSFLPDERCADLRSELFGAVVNGTEYAVEVIQRYHALVGLMKAIARYDERIKARRWASAHVIVKLQYAITMAEQYGWNITWSKYDARVERVQ